LQQPQLSESIFGNYSKIQRKKKEERMIVLMMARQIKSSLGNL
jgi:hypothetical protein